MPRMLLDLARVSLDLDRIFKCAIFLRLLKGLLSIPSWYTTSVIRPTASCEVRGGLLL